jgi:hypothetical protein
MIGSACRVAPSVRAGHALTTCTFWCAQLSQAGAGPDLSLSDHFVEIVKGDFVLGCNKFPISGHNLWEALESGAGAPSLTGSQLPAGAAAAAMLTNVLDITAQNRLTVIRTWAHG